MSTVFITKNSGFIAKNYTFGSYTGNYHPADPRYVTGSLSYYSDTTNSSHFEFGMLDLEDGTFCMYADELVKDAFIVGVTDPNADPLTVVEAYQKFVRIPDLQSDPEN